MKWSSNVTSGIPRIWCTFGEQKHCSGVKIGDSAYKLPLLVCLVLDLG